MLPEMLPRLWTFALRISGDKRDAEDLVQRSCLRALEGVHQLQSDIAPLSWMFAVMHATWMNELQACSVRTRSGMDAEFLDPDAYTPEANALNSQLVSAVQRLPEAERVVMLLVAVEGVSYKEAAEALDVPLDTIMRRLSSARLTIAAQFGAGSNPPVKPCKAEQARGVRTQ